MEFRALLAVALSLVILIGFQYFLGRDVSPRPEEKKTVEKDREMAAGTHGPSGRGEPGGPVLDASVERSAPVVPNMGTTGRLPKEVTVDTDTFHIVFTEVGATLKECFLRSYASKISPDSSPVNLVKVTPPDIPLGLILGTQPTQDLSSVVFEADRGDLTLDESTPEASLTFSFRMPSGAEVKKIYTFHQGEYWVDLSVQTSGLPPTTGTVFLNNRPSSNGSAYIFEGPAYFSQGNLEEVTLDDPGDRQSYTGPIDWVGYGDNYFLTALIPSDPQGPWNVVMEKKDKEGLTETRLSRLEPASNGTGGGVSEVLQLGLYLGPKEIDRLETHGHNLVHAIDFGWFDPIAKPLLYLLKFFYRYMSNYGLAIITLTVLIKLAFWPLAQKGAKSMKKMQKLQPKLAKLKEKYGNDKEKLNKELMQLYKTYKVNPMSGCMPMLLQIPVFFALYKVLLQSIELRHAPFALWIDDLSAPDRLMIPGVDIPYLGGIPVLTLLMGLSMYLQQKLSPSSLDPTQAKMMQFLPIIFTFMFINFPSGLVLYWLVNNVLSIAQQHYVNKFTD
jgi:YidC/Oxa1 family membrane protein insertase